MLLGAAATADAGGLRAGVEQGGFPDLVLTVPAGVGGDQRFPTVLVPALDAVFFDVVL
jgi:hypothetical protein